MRRLYYWPPVEVLVEAPDDAPAYKVTLLVSDYQSTPVAVDAHWGADDAAKIALEVYRRAFADPRKFLAEERMEARHMSQPYRDDHIAWAESVAQGSVVLGDSLEKASERSAEPPLPVDVSRQIDDYLGLVEVGHAIAINTLVSEGHPLAEAREIHVERTLQDFAQKWRLVPSRRLPTAARR